jgi:hypothetical protein
VRKPWLDTSGAGDGPRGNGSNVVVRPGSAKPRTHFSDALAGWPRRDAGPVERRDLPVSEGRPTGDCFREEWAGFKDRHLILRQRGRRRRRREPAHPAGREHTPTHTFSLRPMAPAAAAWSAGRHRLQADDWESPLTMARLSGAAGIQDGLCRLLRDICFRAFGLGSIPGVLQGFSPSSSSGLPHRRANLSGLSPCELWNGMGRSPEPARKPNSAVQYCLFCERRFSSLAHLAAPAWQNTAFRPSRVPILTRAYAGAYAYPAPRSPPEASRAMPRVSAADHGVAKTGQGRARERLLRYAVPGMGGGRAAARRRGRWRLIDWITAHAGMPLEVVRRVGRSCWGRNCSWTAASHWPRVNAWGVSVSAVHPSVQAAPQPFHLDAEAAKEALFDGLGEVDPSPLPR